MLSRVLRRLLALLLVCSVSPVGFGQTANSADLNASRLARVQIFALGPVGFSAKTSEGETAYRTILALPAANALAIFEDVYRTGNSAGKAYALAGIYRLSPVRFNEIYATIPEPGELVVVGSGCLVDSEQLKEVADQIRKGTLEGPQKRVTPR